VLDDMFVAFTIQRISANHLRKDRVLGGVPTDTASVPSRMYGTIAKQNVLRTQCVIHAVLKACMSSPDG
jgi:hypothetical protein